MDQDRSPGQVDDEVRCPIAVDDRLDRQNDLVGLGPGDERACAGVGLLVAEASEVVGLDPKR